MVIVCGDSVSRTVSWVNVVVVVVVGFKFTTVIIEYLPFAPIFTIPQSLTPI